MKDEMKKLCLYAFLYKNMKIELHIFIHKVYA